MDIYSINSFCFSKRRKKFGFKIISIFGGGRDRRTRSSRKAQAKLVRCCLKNKIKVMVGRHTQVVQCLPGKCKALSPILSTDKKIGKEKSKPQNLTIGKHMIHLIILKTWKKNDFMNKISFFKKQI
jgi:hypothetical protein